ncbi:hypothetical protein AVEN_43576-1 [Araneus ventricosus]|uniref:Uncharacterized protein n=1 Tax=Araneus ventricosus TaxID=182803 RepID=A0A4Y2EL40_ARAVE|nr:hypothetical protein AVEN_43576-1 [Araneus ventricosus]
MCAAAIFLSTSATVEKRFDQDIICNDVPTVSYGPWIDELKSMNIQMFYIDIVRIEYADVVHVNHLPAERELPQLKTTITIPRLELLVATLGARL